MHNLEEGIAEWRKTMAAASKVSPETLDELENHLREHVDQLVRSGKSELEALQRAVAQLGGPSAIASEFQKLAQGAWLPIKVVYGICAIVILAAAMLVIARFDSGRLSLLLATHVFTVTVGYTSTFLIGALGICFVSQRCVSDFSPFRSRALTRATFRLSCLATGLTAIGIVLGMIWAKGAWGRYWAWDVKETGAMAVILWQVCFLVAHRLGRVTARGLLVMSLLGNIVVSLGWFGVNLVSGLHAYGTPNYSAFLLAAVVSNVALFLIGLAPAGWLRLRRVS